MEPEQLNKAEVDVERMREHVRRLAEVGLRHEWRLQDLERQVAQLQAQNSEATSQYS